MEDHALELLLVLVLARMEDHALELLLVLELRDEASPSVAAGADQDTIKDLNGRSGPSGLRVGVDIVYLPGASAELPRGALCGGHEGHRAVQLRPCLQAELLAVQPQVVR